MAATVYTVGLVDSTTSGVVAEVLEQTCTLCRKGNSIPSFRLSFSRSRRGGGRGSRFFLLPLCQNGCVAMSWRDFCECVGWISISFKSPVKLRRALAFRAGRGSECGCHFASQGGAE